MGRVQRNSITWSLCACVVIDMTTLTGHKRGWQGENEMIYTLLSTSSEMLAFVITQFPASVYLLSVNFSNSIFNLQSISTKFRLLKTFHLLNMLSSSRLSYCYFNLLLFIWQNLQFHYSSIRFRVLVIIFKYFSLSILVTLLVRGHCVNRLNFLSFHATRID